MGVHKQVWHCKLGKFYCRNIHRKIRNMSTVMCGLLRSTARTITHPLDLPVVITCRAMAQNSTDTEINQQNKSTLNQEEVDKFRRLAQGLLSMNKLRVPLIKDGLVNSGRVKVGNNAIEPLSGLRILDVGCGAGLLSEPLARLG